MKRSKKAKQKERNGQVLRLSKELLDLFPRDGKESYDQAFRRKLGMDSKAGEPSKDTYWLITKPKPQVFKNKAQALGASILSMVSDGRKHKERIKKVVVFK